MKKLLAIIASLAFFLPLTQAQTDTNTPPSSNISTNTVDDVLSFLSHTNLYAGAGISYDLTDHRVGAVVGLGYILDLPLVQDTVVPEVRLDYDGQRPWAIEGTLQIRLPRSIAGRWVVRPFGEVAIATSFAGAGANNGTAVPITGTGLTFHLYKHLGGIVGYEWWFFPQKTHDKVLSALTLKF